MKQHPINTGAFPRGTHFPFGFNLKEGIHQFFRGDTDAVAYAAQLAIKNGADFYDNVFVMSVKLSEKPCLILSAHKYSELNRYVWTKFGKISDAQPDLNTESFLLADLAAAYCPVNVSLNAFNEIESFESVKTGERRQLTPIYEDRPKEGTKPLKDCPVFDKQIIGMSNRLIFINLEKEVRYFGLSDDEIEEFEAFRHLEKNGFCAQRQQAQKIKSHS